MVWAAVLGALCGPFVRFIILYGAVPAGEPWRAGCPYCGAVSVPLRPTGRCAGCRGRIGPPPGLVELVAAATLALLNVHSGPWLRPALGWAALLGVGLAFVDARVRRLPDPLTAALFAGVVACFALSGSYARLGWALAYAALAGLLYLALALVSRGGMGLGDVKLALGVGLVLGWFGWPAVLFGLAAGFALAGAYGLLLIVSRGVGRKDALPHGPFMLLGALVALVTA